MSEAEITILYDGKCPLCTSDLAMLERIDRRHVRLGWALEGCSAVRVNPVGCRIVVEELYRVLPASSSWRICSQPM